MLKEQVEGDITGSLAQSPWIFFFVAVLFCIDLLIIFINAPLFFGAHISDESFFILLIPTYESLKNVIVLHVFKLDVVSY